MTVPFSVPPLHPATPPPTPPRLPPTGDAVLAPSGPQRLSPRCQWRPGADGGPQRLLQLL